MSKTIDKRNLFVWRGSVWYSRVIGGRRFRVDTKCPVTEQGWKDARLYRDEYERQKAIDQPTHRGRIPTFAVMAQRYLDETRRSSRRASSRHASGICERMA